MLETGVAADRLFEQSGRKRKGGLPCYTATGHAQRNIPNLLLYLGGGSRRTDTSTGHEEESAQGHEWRKKFTSGYVRQ